MKKSILLKSILAAMLLVTAAWPGAAIAGNDITGPVWVIDTNGVITTDTVRIRAVAWFDCTTDNHQFYIQNSSGKTVWKDSDGEASKAHVFYLDIETSGVSVYMQSGYLLIDAKAKSY
jgi:hypothetical protein